MTNPDQHSSPVNAQEQATIAYIVLRAMQAKVNSDTYGVDHALKINTERAGAAAAEIMALRRHAQCAWRPMDTIPKDESLAILFSPSTGLHMDAIWTETEYAPGIPWGWGSTRRGRITDATHWMPFPKPPSALTSTDGGTEQFDQLGRDLNAVHPRKHLDELVDDPAVTRPDGGGTNG